MIKYDHQEKAISLHHFRHLWQIYRGVSWALLTTLIMTKRNLHLAPGKWELKELKVFWNIFGELWTFIGTCAIVRGLIWPLLSSHANLNLQLRCANWKSSVLKPAAHSILTPLVSLQVSTRRPKSTKVTCAHCSKYDSTISQHFGSLVSDTLQGLSRNFFWWRRKHYVLVTSQRIPHQLNLCYFIFHSCSLLPGFTMQNLFFSICFHRHDWRLQSDVLDFRWWCFQHFFLCKSCFLLLQSLVV